MSENKNPSFWSSLPGVITALAGMITAIAVLVTTLANLPSSNSSSSRSNEPSQAAASGATGSSAAASPGTGTAAPVSSASATASAETPQAKPAEILFYAVRDDPATGGQNADLFAVNPANGDERRVTTDPEPDSDPAWSPDRSRIAYDSKRVNGNRNIWVLEADGSYTALTDDTLSNAYPTWSPDGERIAWTVGPRGDREIWAMDAHTGGNRKRLTSGHDDSLPSWSAKGQIAFVRKAGSALEIWVVNPDDRSTSSRITAGDGGGFDPAWSPDGARLAFVRRNRVALVYVVSANGQSGLRQLTPASSCDCVSPTWSPDGRQIAYTGPGGPARPVVVINASGGSTKRVTTNGLSADWGR
jgi:Tol biopolymer transport system component